jgi:hypothetical protein
MGFFYFVIGVIVGTLLLVLLPLFIAVLGVALAVGFAIALPLIAAVLVLVGIRGARRRIRARHRGPADRTVGQRPQAAPAALAGPPRSVIDRGYLSPLSSAGSCNVVSCPRTGSAMASSRLRAPFHSAGGRTYPLLPI